MTKLKARDLVTVDSVRTANSRLVSRDSTTGRFNDPAPPKGGWVVVKEQTRTRGDIAAAGKLAMSKHIKGKK